MLDPVLQPSAELSALESPAFLHFEEEVWRLAKQSPMEATQWEALIVPGRL